MKKKFGIPLFCIIFVAMAKRVEKEKPWADGKMTDSAFWGMIRSALRNKSRFFNSVKVAKERARREYKGENARQKWEYICNSCNKWYKSTEVEIHHLEPCGSLKSADDLSGFVTRLFCNSSKLTCLCKKCHKNIEKDLEN